MSTRSTLRSRSRWYLTCFAGRSISFPISPGLAFFSRRIARALTLVGWEVATSNSWMVRRGGCFLLSVLALPANLCLPISLLIERSRIKAAKPNKFGLLFKPSPTVQAILSDPDPGRVRPHRRTDPFNSSSSCGTEGVRRDEAHRQRGSGSDANPHSQDGLAPWGEDRRSGLFWDRRGSFLAAVKYDFSSHQMSLTNEEIASKIM